jgi:lysosomal alpha-glucosidase
MYVRACGVSHGVMLLNRKGMDVEYGGSYLIYRTIGRVLDFYFFLGPSLFAIVQQYTELIV